MMAESGVDLLLHSLVVDVVRNGNDVGGVVVENAAGRQYYEARVVVECTGEGDIAVRAGSEYELLSREESEPHTVCFTLDGIDWDKLLANIKAHPDQIQPRGNPDRTPEERYELIRGVGDIGELGDLLGWYDFLDAAIKTATGTRKPAWAFSSAKPDGNHLQAHFQHSSQVPGLWSCESVGPVLRRDRMPPPDSDRRQSHPEVLPGLRKRLPRQDRLELRLREGRRIMGDYVLKREDVGSNRRFYDCIGKTTFGAGAVHVANNNTLGASKTASPASPTGERTISVTGCSCREGSKTCSSPGSMSPPSAPVI